MATTSATVVPTASSAACGTLRAGWTAARSRGRSPAAAIANTVRLTPASRGEDDAERGERGSRTDDRRRLPEASAKKRKPADASTPCNPLSGQSGRSRSASSSPASRAAATTKASVATTATTIKARRPRRLRHAVSAATAAIRSGRA